MPQAFNVIGSGIIQNDDPTLKTNLPQAFPFLCKLPPDLA